MDGTASLACRELVELVTEYLDDAMPLEERVRFDAHLADCEGCEAHLDQMRETIRLTGSLSEVSLPRRICDQLLEAFGRRRPG